MARSLYGLSGPLLGIKFEVEGEEHLEGLMTARDGQHQGAVLLSNHQRWVKV